MWGSNPHPPTRSNYAVCLQAVYDLAVSAFCMSSATHGTKNIIANRLVAVSERILIGKSGVYTENNNESRIEGSNPSVPMVPSWSDTVCVARSRTEIWSEVSAHSGEAATIGGVAADCKSVPKW